MRHADSSLAQRGVTLIEMIVVIVITGILAATVSMFVRNQVQNYTDVAARAELADAADGAVRRIARELQGALPNSVRVSGNFLEFVPIRDAGRYRAEVGINPPCPAGPPCDDPLDFTMADTTFDVLGPPVTVTAGDSLVVYNMGVPGASVYDTPLTSRRLATAGVGLNNVAFTAIAGVPLPFASPQNRFQIVGGPVTLECAPNAAAPELGTITRRWCYAYSDPQPLAFGALAAHPGCAALQSAVVVSGVSACGLNYAAGALQRNGIVSIRFTLSRNGENVPLFHQVTVMNTP